MSKKLWCMDKYRYIFQQIIKTKCNVFLLWNFWAKLYQKRFRNGRYILTFINRISQSLFTSIQLKILKPCCMKGIIECFIIIVIWYCIYREIINKICMMNFISKILQNIVSCFCALKNVFIFRVKLEIDRE